MKFNEKMIYLREKSNKTQEEAAKEMGISRRTLQTYEYKEAEPTLNKLIKIAEYYNVSLDWLTGRTHNPEINHEQLDHGKNVG